MKPKEERIDLYNDIRKAGLIDIPQTIKRMRAQANMTQEQYAAFVKVDLKTLRNAEQGKEVSISTLNKIGKPFRFRVGYVVDDR